MAPNDLEELSALFPVIGEDVVNDILMQCHDDYQKAYAVLLDMCPPPQEMSHSATGNDIPNGDDGGGDVCRFVRFVTLQTRNPSEDCVQLSRIVLFANGRPLNVQLVVNPKGHNPSGEGSNNLKDLNLHTKWLDWRKRPVILELAPNDATTPDAYVLVTANDCPHRDPVRWIVESSANGQSWTLLDDCSRSNQDITHSRLEPTLPFVIGGSARPPAKLSIPMPLSDREQIAAWTKVDRKLPLEFEQAASSICIVPKLMRTSRMDHKIALLEALQREDSKVDGTVEATVGHLVSKAFGLSCFWSPARTYMGYAPGHAGLHGKFSNGVMNVYMALEPWQKPLFHAALEQMLSQDSDSLKIMCKLLLQASEECMARKQQAFMVAIDRSVDHDTKETVHDLDTLAHHKQLVFDAAQTSIDELKSMAFKSVFLEPTKLYFRAVADTVMEGDVDVHGSNTYLALLLAALRVKLAHSPMLSDEVKGIVAFQDALSAAHLDQLWDPVNKGKSWEIVLGRAHPTVEKRIARNQFYFRGATAGQLANDCLENRAARSQFRPYAEAFARFFSQEVAVEWLCNAFLARDDIGKSLNTLFATVASPDEVADADGDVRYWLWDLMVGDFRLDRALRLLRFAGICREEEESTLSAAQKRPRVDDDATSDVASDEETGADEAWVVL